MEEKKFSIEELGKIKFKMDRVVEKAEKKTGVRIYKIFQIVEDLIKDRNDNIVRQRFSVSDIQKKDKTISRQEIEKWCQILGYRIKGDEIFIPEWKRK